MTTYSNNLTGRFKSFLQVIFTMTRRPVTEQKACTAKNLYQRNPIATTIRSAQSVFMDEISNVKRVHVHALIPYVIPSAMATTQSTATSTSVLANLTAVSWFQNFLGHLDFAQVLILILIVALFFKDELMIVVKRYIGAPEGSILPPAVATQKTQDMMGQLVQHFNHETTELLTNILQELKYVRKDQNTQGEKLNTIIARVEEMIKYGVPDRK